MLIITIISVVFASPLFFYYNGSAQNFFIFQTIWALLKFLFLFILLCFLASWDWIRWLHPQIVGADYAIVPEQPIFVEDEEDGTLGEGNQETKSGGDTNARIQINSQTYKR